MSSSIGGGGSGSTIGSYGELGRGAYEKRAHLLVETVQKGLETVPVPTEDEDNDDTLSATKKKHLLAASRHLNEAVILPLEDLAHRTISALDSVRDIYDDQVRFLEGSRGFKSKLQDLNDTHKATLTRRIDSIGTRLLLQRTRARELLSKYASHNASRATEQEKAYARQLGEWKGQLGMMQSAYQLGCNGESLHGRGALHMDGNATTKSSLRARHGIEALPLPWAVLWKPEYCTSLSRSPTPAKAANTNTAHEGPPVPESSSWRSSSRFDLGCESAWREQYYFCKCKYRRLKCAASLPCSADAVPGRRRRRQDTWQLWRLPPCQSHGQPQRQ